jgi:hypothetical protein
LLGLVVVFAISGFFRGSVRQVFGLVGFVAGLWVAIVVSRWVGARWEGARPAVALWAFRWLAAGIAALVVGSLFHWWGGLVRKVVQGGPAGGLDRVLGLAVGVLVGLAWAIALLTVGLLAPDWFGMRAAAARARTPHALVSLGANACDAVERRVPMFHGLGRLLHEAERRARVHSPSS